MQVFFLKGRPIVSRGSTLSNRTSYTCLPQPSGSMPCSLLCVTNWISVLIFLFRSNFKCSGRMWVFQPSRKHTLTWLLRLTCVKLLLDYFALRYDLVVAVTSHISSISIGNISFSVREPVPDALTFPVFVPSPFDLQYTVVVRQPESLLQSSSRSKRNIKCKQHDANYV